MTDHIWGDKDFDWDALYEAQVYIIKYVRRKSRCHLICKEKYGTIRYEWVFPPYGSVRLKGITLPFFKKKTKYGDIPIYLFQWNRSNWLYRWWESYGWRCTREAVFKAIQKWPHLEDELLEDLASNIEIVGKEIHDKYWQTLK